MERLQRGANARAFVPIMRAALPREGGQDPDVIPGESASSVGRALCEPNRSITTVTRVAFRERRDIAPHVSHSLERTAGASPEEARSPATAARVVTRNTGTCC